MHIDWFVLFAQIVNFLILVFLLKHFLYDRILNAMDARQAKLVSEYEQAGRLKEDAKVAAEAYEEKYQALRQSSEDLMDKARDEAERLQKDLMNEARKEIDLVRQRWHEAIAREKKTLLEQLRRKSGSHIYEIVRRILTDLAYIDLEQRIIDKFIDLIRHTSPETQGMIQEYSSSADAIIIIRSAFVISPEHRNKIRQTLRPLLSEDIPLRYETVPEIVAGLEMVIQAHKISWSINNYLTSLEDGFSQALKDAGITGLQ